MDKADGICNCTALILEILLFPKIEPAFRTEIGVPKIPAPFKNSNKNQVILK